MLEKSLEAIKVINKHGKELSFNSVIQHMDDEIREFLHGELAPCEPQYFYEKYCEEHKKKYGEEFLTEDKNIVW